MSKRFPEKRNAFTIWTDLSKDKLNNECVVAMANGKKGGLSEVASRNAVPSKICRATSNRAAVSGPTISPFLPATNNIKTTNAIATVLCSNR